MNIASKVYPGCVPSPAFRFIIRQVLMEKGFAMKKKKRGRDDGQTIIYFFSLFGGKYRPQRKQDRIGERGKREGKRGSKRDRKNMYVGEMCMQKGLKAVSTRTYVLCFVALIATENIRM